jgi:hypothetical protein
VAPQISQLGLRGDTRKQKLSAWMVPIRCSKSATRKSLGFINRERAAIQRLGLREAFRVLEQLGEVVEAGRYIGMIRTVARLGDCERALHQRLGIQHTSRIPITITSKFGFYSAVSDRRSRVQG